MRRIIYCFGLWAGLLLTGCNATRHAYHGFRPAEVQTLATLRPVASMALVVRGDEAHPDAWFSGFMAKQLHHSLLRQTRELQLQVSSAPDDSLSREPLRREIERAAAHLARQPELGYAEALPAVEGVLGQQPGRYALLLMARGYMRTADNYRQEASRRGQQRAMFGAVGAGAYNTMPSRLGLYVLVYDREQHRVVYYGHRQGTASELLKPEALDKQLRQLLAADFGPGARR